MDRDARAELRSLSKTVADTVARRLVAAGELLNVDPELSLGHALAARRAASRVAAVREAVGLAAYQCGQWQLAISELRAYHRMTGRQTHLAVLADCERGLGRPERAVDMWRRADENTLGAGEWAELLIVAAGARRDMDQMAAAVTMLQVPSLNSDGPEPWRARLRYAYADALAETGRAEEAYQWFARAVELDPAGDTDAMDRLLELEGVVIEGDELDESDDDEAAATGSAKPAAESAPADSAAPPAAPATEPVTDDPAPQRSTAGANDADPASDADAIADSASDTMVGATGDADLGEDGTGEPTAGDEGADTTVGQRSATDGPATDGRSTARNDDRAAHDGAEDQRRAEDQ
ncbi:MAG: tetratricopeptide repeat protein [Actinocatenispora sp.]